MASEYQLVTQLPGTMQTVQRMADQAFIPFDGGNRDYAEFVQWCAEGNEPDPAPQPPSPPPPEPLKLAADPVDAMDAATRGYVDREVSRAAATTLPA